jgi:hypothetical protein
MIGRTPGGKHVKDLLAFATPEVKTHKGHLFEQRRTNIEDRFDETAFSEQSFADLSLMSGNVSVQVIDNARKATK